MSHTLTIFNIQHYCVHDGPGIRTTLFLKGCPLACQWCCNPESQRYQSQFRYTPIRCKQCGNCLQACSHQSITRNNGVLSFDFKTCNQCVEKPCLETCYHNALSVVGNVYSMEKAMEIIEKDNEFYHNSGGGVTFSGGEPFVQAEALTQILRLCKDKNISTAVETCGYVTSEKLADVAPWVDLFLFDLKIINEAEHIRYTGKSNRLILENLAYLSRLNKRIIARIPLIPEATDRLENIRDIIAVCLENNIKEATLGIYHRLGQQKYTDFGISYPFEHDMVERDNDYYLNICRLFQESDISCEIL